MRVGGQENILQCRSGNTYFEAWIPTPNADPIPLEPRDLIQITGIYEATTTHPMPRMEWADGFRVHLAGADAVTVLRKAPWWTLERLLLALGIAMAAILAFLIWTSLLRRRVAAQTQIITRQVEREVVKDERQRIARELHDTLEQDLTGLSMQLENATEEIGEANGPAYRSLTLVHRMLQHCRLEARASVSDLRNPDVLVRHLPEAMRESLNEKIRETNATLDFSVEGSPQPLRSTTQNHLLRIAREALTNALRHGFPEDQGGTINVLLEPAGEDGLLTICDDGIGSSDGDDPAGMGLELISALTSQLEGQLTLSQTAGGGRTVAVRFPCREAVPSM
jgi:signal transduction histidine kinase